MCIVVCTVNGESTVMGSGDGPAAATVISAGTASTTVSNGGIKCDSQQQQHSNAVIGIVTAEVLCVCIVLCVRVSFSFTTTTVTPTDTLLASYVLVVLSIF